MSNNPYPFSRITETGSVIVYSPTTFTDDLICSLSPTSSLKGIYVRSRPASMEVPTETLGFDFGGVCQVASNRTVQQGHQSTLSSSTRSDESEHPTTSSGSSHVSSAATAVFTDEKYIQKNTAKRTAETRARVKALNEGHARAGKHYAESIAPSFRTTASNNTVMNFRLGRHENKKGDHGATCQNIEEGDDLVRAPESLKDRVRADKKRSIPLFYRVVTKVHGVFHRKARSTPESFQLDPLFSDNSVNDATALVREPSPVQPFKSSSVSLFTKKRRPAIDSQQEPPHSKNIFCHRSPPVRENKNSIPMAPNTVNLISTSLAIENHARLRRSVSFSGFADLPEAEVDNELDEATAEATQLAIKASAMIRWTNVLGRGCDSDGVDDDYVFERNVE